MEYAIVPLDSLPIELRRSLVEKKQYITRRDLIIMNAAARIEMAKGHIHLNSVLIRATDSLVNNEINLSIDARQSRGDNDVAI